MFILAAVALAPLAAHAQTDRRFFGTWKPDPTIAGASPLTIEPGRITTWDKDEMIWDERYEIIRDFGDRIVVREWTVESDFEFTLNRSAVSVLSLKRSGDKDGHGLILSRDFCHSDWAHEYFFKTGDRDEIWQRILSWSARRDEGYPYQDCNMNRDGGEVGTWKGSDFSRAARPGE